VRARDGGGGREEGEETRVGKEGKGDGGIEFEVEKRDRQKEH
jgi:hypothetical protein